jgi:hypothetical protein
MLLLFRRRGGSGHDRAGQAGAPLSPAVSRSVLPTLACTGSLPTLDSPSTNGVVRHYQTPRLPKRTDPLQANQAYYSASRLFDTCLALADFSLFLFRCFICLVANPPGACSYLPSSLEFPLVPTNMGTIVA